MKKLKDLTASDFPGTDPQKFEEWKGLSIKLNKAHILGILWWATGLITVPLIGGGLGYLLPIIFWFTYMFTYTVPLANHEKRLAKELGIDRAAVKRALSK